MNNPVRMIRIKICTISILMLLASAMKAQDANNGSERKQATAARVVNGSIDVAGRLNEQAWTRAVPITDFVQKEPNEGATPTEKMEVRIVYDSRAVYIGARMYKRGQSAIQASERVKSSIMNFIASGRKRTAFGTHQNVRK